MAQNTPLTPSNDDQTRIDILRAEAARALSENPNLLDQQTKLYHGQQTPASIKDVADLKTQIFHELPSSELHTDVSLVKPAAPEKVEQEVTVDLIASEAHTKVERAVSSSSSPQLEASELPEEEAAQLIEEIENEEIPVNVELPLELLVQQDKLTVDDIEALLKYLHADPTDARLWSLIDRVARHPIDAQVIRANLADLDADLLDSILIVGSSAQTVTDELTGQSKTIYLYGGYEVGKGGLGEVAEVSIAEQNNLKLRHSLIKLPLLKTLELNLDFLFVLEAKIGKRLRQLADLNPYDPRLKHVLIPEIITDDFIIFPQITNEEGKSQTLNEIMREEKPSLARFARTLSGMASGLSFLSDYDIIAIDNKDSNYMESQDRGCLIDLGGFLSMDSFKSGEVQIGKLLDGSDCPIFTASTLTIPFTPNYSNNQLMSQELREEIPNDVTHKLTIARVIEKYLAGYVKKTGNLNEWKEYGNKGALEKLDHPPMNLSNIVMTPAQSRLYQLYLGLYNSHLHPHKYHQADPALGVDPQYLSLSQAEDILLEISKM